VPTFAVHTLGCRANQADGERLAQILSGAGFAEVPFGQPADVQIINSCTVTSEADRKSAQMVRKAQGLGSQVVLTGCGAAQKGGAWKRTGSVLRLPPERQEEILGLLGATHCPSAESFERPLLRRDRARVLLRVQDGCDQFCTFCIVPYVRGRARSRSLAEVRSEVVELERNGTREVVLSGIHLSAWGQDLGLTLTDLVRDLLEHTSQLRVRLGSVEPDLFPLELIPLMGQNPRLCPHLHLVLQHASDAVLERMHRGYTLAHYQVLVEQFLAIPGACLSSDIMVGFPGESEAEFRQLLSYVRATGFARLHVFPYSLRPGTAAAKMGPQVTPEVIRLRRDRLLKLAAQKHVQFLRSQLGTRRTALVEGPGRATTDNYVNLQLRGGQALRGQLIEVDLLRRRGLEVVGQPYFLG
jgi:threonylcarbamoyladenosine tRNA methylthiotransferase MtaB